MIYIVVGSVVFFFVALLLAVLKDGRQLREQQALHRRRVEDYERERLFAEKWPSQGSIKEG